MIRRREKEKKEFSLIISLESLINQSVWEWGGFLSVTVPSFQHWVHQTAQGWEIEKSASWQDLQK